MLELRDVYFRAGGREILGHISLKTKDGEILAITGPNGSGKSTLMKAIMGINKADGAIIFDGQDISDLNCTERARAGVSYAFQQPVHFKGLTVRDLLQVAATGGESLYAEASNNLEKSLETVGLDGSYLEREINASLSGGELKRIEIASVIARNAKLMLFDEPEAGIDIWSFSRLISVFKKLRGDHTLIIISHQKKLLEIADRIAVMKDGRIQKIGPASKILPELEDAR